MRIPRENLLNSVADVTPDGQYVSSIKDPDQVRLWRLLILLLVYYLHHRTNQNLES